jgi:hypothetical protein
VEPRHTVYVIASEGGPVKVGVSGRDGEARLEDIRRMSPLPLHVAFQSRKLFNAYEVEHVAHRELERYRSHGEWFNVSAEIAAQAVERAIAICNGNKPASSGQLTYMERVDRYDRMMAMLMQGQSLIEVARHFGKHVNQVRQILSRMPRPPA